MMRSTLADFEQAMKDDGPDFWLGRYVRTWTVGEFAFVEFLPWDNIDIFKRRGVLETPNYLVFIDGKETHYVADSLDIAMVLAVARKHDGENSHAASYFAKMVGMNTRWNRKAS
jgi:hypothetical protein